VTTLGETDNAASSDARPHQPPLRASDVDRLATVKVLQDAVARGLLTPDEGSDRMAAAFAAVHLHELEPLTADLPSGRASRTAPGWRPLGLMAVEQVRSSVHGLTSGRLSPARIAAVFVLAVLVLAAIGSIVGELFFDGHGFDGDGGAGHGGFELED
jgi:Domain of unknown function (DUF1707)